MNVTKKTQLNLVIGYPLEHTQSPELHQAVYQQFGIDAVLLAQPQISLELLIQAIKILSVKLTAVTLPYKEKVIPYLDECSEEVKALHAANTIIQRQEKLYGYNTDIDGIAFALRDVVVQGKQILVIGAGGAARAIGYFLKKNCANILWINRTQNKAMTLANKFGGEVICHNKLNTTHIDIIINTTPIGMYPHADASPLFNYAFNRYQTVFDMVYHPMMTQLLKQAQKNEAKIISGLDMFIGQGLKQIELYTGKQHTPVMINQLRQLLIKNQRRVRT